MKTCLLLTVALSLLSGCSVISANRVFPKLDWAWSKDAQMQRESRARETFTDPTNPPHVGPDTIQ